MFFGQTLFSDDYFSDYDRLGMGSYGSAGTSFTQFKYFSNSEDVKVYVDAISKSNSRDASLRKQVLHNYQSFLPIQGY